MCRLATTKSKLSVKGYYKNYSARCNLTFKISIRIEIVLTIIITIPLTKLINESIRTKKTRRILITVVFLNLNGGYKNSFRFSGNFSAFSILNLSNVYSHKKKL